MADVEKLTVTLEANVANYNADLAKAAQTTAQQTKAMENSFARLGTFGQRTPQNFDKIAAGMSSVGKAALHSHVEQELLNTSLSKAEIAAGGVTHAIGAMSTQGMAAFHALRGGAEQLLAGQDPFRVLALELNNLTYAASGAGGLKTAFGEAIGIFRGLLNPVVALTGGIVGLGLAAIGLQARWASAQEKINLALTGVGKSAGITAGQVNQIADAVSKSGEVSRSEASDIATAIASTGRASADATEQATALAKSYSLVFNKDLDKSAMDLANAIANPGAAIDALNARLGVWSAKQIEMVKNLDASGQRQKAAKILIDGLKDSIGEAAEKTDFWSRSWDKVSTSISNFFTATGKGIDKAIGNQSPEDALVDRLADAKDRLEGLRSGHFNLLGGVSFGDPAEIKKTSDEVKDLEAQLNALRKTSEDTRDAADVSNLVKNIDPTIQKLNDLQTTIDKIKSVPTDKLDAASQAVVKNVLSSLQSQHDLLAKDISLSQQKYGVTLAQASAEERAAKIEIDGIKARTPAQKADVEYLRTRNALLDQGKNPKEAENDAQLARTKSLTEAQYQLSEAQRDRIFQSQQSVDQTQVENSTIGRSVDVATTLTQRFQLLAAARAEAHKNGTVVSPDEIAAMDRAAASLGKLAQANAALNAQHNARFDIAQLGRDRQEQNVFGTLESDGLLDNGQIVSAQAKQTAEILRTREALADLADTEKTFASNFLHDLIEGKSAAAALGDALNAVASKLLESGIDSLIAGATSSGANKSILSLFGFADGGVFVPGKGPQKLKTFAGGGISNQAAIFGEAGPEAAIPLKGGKVPVDLRMPKVAAAPISTPNVNITINAPNSTKESVDAMNANTIPKIREIVRSEILQTAHRSSAFKKAIRQ
jgi:hypothetical protein